MTICYGNTIKLKHPPGKKIKRVIKMLTKRCEQIRECNIHEVDYIFGNEKYKKYSRGKNRCNRCGVKL